MWGGGRDRQRQIVRERPTEIKQTGEILHASHSDEQGVNRTGMGLAREEKEALRLE